MSNIRQTRNRIKSVKNIQQITRAMKMVASARMHKAQIQLLETRPYSGKLREMIQHLAGHAHGELHPLFSENRSPRTGWVVLTSDKGLCAGFNIQTLQVVGRRLVEATPDQDLEVIAVGRKGLDFFRRTGVKPYREWAGFWQELSWYHADIIGQEIIDGYIAGQWSSVALVYNRFKSALAQEVIQESLLPLPKPARTGEDGNHFREYEFEPSTEEIYASLLPRYVKISIWRALLESKAAELAARMQAMDNATESAGEMIDDLTLKMNRARQALITREISELMGSAEAVTA